MTRRLAFALSVSTIAAACSSDSATHGNGAGDASAGSAGASGSSATGGASGSGASAGSGGSAGTEGATGSGGASGSGGSGDAGAGASGGASGGAAGSLGVGGSSDAGPACVEGGAPGASIEDAIARSCVIAVVRVSRLDEECSGAGGTHVTFVVVEVGRGGAVTSLHHGGHAYSPPSDGPDALGEFFVAGIDPLGSLTDRPDNPGWCLTGLPPVDGYAHTLLAASDEADARTKLQTILRR